MLMAKDAADRKGVPFDEKKWYADREVKKSGGDADPLTMIKNGIKIVMTAYTEDNHPGVAKTCFATCAIYAGNVLKDVNDPKY